MVYGWQCRKNTAVYSTAGYFKNGVKTAVANTEAKSFFILDGNDDHVVYTRQVQEKRNHFGCFGVLDFTEVEKEGIYRIKVGEFISEKFQISDTVMEETVWKLVNFLFSERCGYPVLQKHGV